MENNFTNVHIVVVAYIYNIVCMVTVLLNESHILDKCHYLIGVICDVNIDTIACGTSVISLVWCYLMKSKSAVQNLLNSTFILFSNSRLNSLEVVVNTSE